MCSFTFFVNNNLLRIKDEVYVITINNCWELSREMTYAPSFVLGKSSLEKTPLNLGSQLKYLLISILLEVWGGNKTFYPYNRYYYILFLLSWHFFRPLWLLFQICFNNISAINRIIPPPCLFSVLITRFAKITPNDEEVTV